jgi:uncharacterized protein
VTVRRYLAGGLVTLLILASLWIVFAAGSPPAEGAKKGAKRVLVFSDTNGYRHASIPVGVATVKQLGAQNGFAVDATEDRTYFLGPTLRRYDAVIFLNTVGDVLGKRNQRALKRFVKRGGGYVGIHAAADTEHEFPFYGGIVGARFKSHPLQQSATFVNEAPGHPATRHLAPQFSVFDEFYSFNRNPRKYVRVLLSVDESTYAQDPNTTWLPGGTPTTGVMGDHPMAWCHDRLGGRSFYTALGHEPHLFLLDWFRKHILAGIQYATGEIDANCG